MCYGLTINTIHFSQLTHIIKHNMCITEKNRQFHSDLHRLFTANLVSNIDKYFFGKFDLGFFNQWECLNNPKFILKISVFFQDEGTEKVSLVDWSI